MNSDEHLGIAFISIIIFYFFLKFIGLISYFGYASALIVGSVLPDIIEPAKNYKHRKYFHSKRFLKVLAISLIPFFIIGIFNNLFLYGLFLIIGYILHLGLDSSTKMGLPK